MITQRNVTALQLTAMQDLDWKYRQKLGLISYSGCICDDGRFLETFQPPTGSTPPGVDFGARASCTNPPKCAQFFPHLFKFLILVIT